MRQLSNYPEKITALTTVSVCFIIKTCPCDIKRFFSVAKITFSLIFFDNFNIFAQNMHYVSTHNVCFGSKIRKLCIPM